MIIVFIIPLDITSLESFTNLQRWVDKVVSEAERNAAIVIVGNKLDLVESNPSLRRVDTKEAMRYAAKINATLFESSAKNGMNVDQIFETLVNHALERQTIANSEKKNSSNNSNSSNSSSATRKITMTHTNESDSKKCCD